jgi:hypothetical protein
MIQRGENFGFAPKRARGMLGLVREIFRIGLRRWRSKTRNGKQLAASFRRLEREAPTGLFREVPGRGIQEAAATEH